MKKKYCKKEKELVKRREEDGNGVQEVEERGRENWERRIGEEKGKRERETRREEVEQNGRTLLKFSKKNLSVSQDYPPLNNSVFFYIAIQTTSVFLITSAIKITVINFSRIRTSHSGKSYCCIKNKATYVTINKEYIKLNRIY